MRLVSKNDMIGRGLLVLAILSSCGKKGAGEGDDREVIPDEMVLVGEREKERAAVRDVTAGVSAPRTATHTSFTCRGGRKDGVDSPAPLAHPVPCY